MINRVASGELRAYLGILSVALSTIVVGSGCATNPATGKRQLMMMSEAQEIALGQQSDPQIVAAYGLYGDPELQAYVERIGLELARTSERPDLPWTFRVLDDPVVNAFALPGGFIYVTRGIMAYLNSEAELAGVLGHEIGHVTARHGANQVSKQQLAGFGLGVGMILAPELAQSYGGLAQQATQLMFLKFGRDDERQADELGFRYSVRGNYDVREMPNVFETLRRVSEATGGGRVPAWMSTHPDPGARARTTAAMVAESGLDFDTLDVRRDFYLERIDGMVFGANPREGYFDEDGRFLHPELAFALDFPADWQTVNQRRAVIGLSPERDAIMQLTLAEQADPAAASREFLSQDGLTGGRVRTFRVNGLQAAGGSFEATSGSQEVSGLIAHIRYGQNTYALLGYGLTDTWDERGRQVDRWIGSFDRVTDQGVLSVQPARLDIVDLKRSLPLDEFARRYPTTADAETLAMINQVGADGLVGTRPGVKRVLGGKQ